MTTITQGSRSIPLETRYDISDPFVVHFMNGWCHADWCAADWC